ncbi:MAG: 16S rRNA (guanine(527)-N(7))-methyltransferase RsmG [Burkholderiales bacterium]|nr:16S rRNA (guanine(527)-N(7))-methyltransferase RsmG [Burkholderiales bacterium]
MSTAVDPLAEALSAGLDAIGLAVPCAVRAKLMAHLDLLAKWNATFNLTAIRDRAQMVSHHLLDSLCVARYVRPGPMLDVGSGGGMPGVCLAIWAQAAMPDLQVTVLDANHKKAAFLRQAKITLDLPNLEVSGERVEEFRPAHRFRQIVSRAFSDLVEFFQLTRHLGGDAAEFPPAGTEWLAMKGVMPHEEIAHLPPQCRLAHVHRLQVPGLAAERHLVVMHAQD